jgi:Mce-associated membrane protein
MSIGSETTMLCDTITDDAKADVDDAIDAVEEVEASAAEDDAEEVEELAKPDTRFSWRRIVAYGVLPGLVLVLTLCAGYLKWQDGSAQLSQEAAVASVQVATEGTIAMLSYHADTADKELTAARDRLTGSFRDDYTKLINDVVIPGATQGQISTVATVPAAASVSVNENHAVVLVFVNQAVTVGKDAPSNTTSAVKVTLEKSDSRWLISGFEPV